MSRYSYYIDKTRLMLDRELEGGVSRISSESTVIVLVQFSKIWWFTVTHTMYQGISIHHITHNPSVLLYAVFASYFAGVMVRLMLTLTPVVCILSAIALSVIMEKYLSKPPPQEVIHCIPYSLCIYCLLPCTVQLLLHQRLFSDYLITEQLCNYGMMYSSMTD